MTLMEDEQEILDLILMPYLRKRRVTDTESEKNTMDSPKRIRFGSNLHDHSQSEDQDI